MLAEGQHLLTYLHVPLCSSEVWCVLQSEALPAVERLSIIYV